MKKFIYSFLIGGFFLCSITLNATGIQIYDEDGGLVSATNFPDGADCNIGIGHDGTVLYAIGADCGPQQ